MIKFIVSNVESIAKCQQFTVTFLIIASAVSVYRIGQAASSARRKVLALDVIGFTIWVIDMAKHTRIMYMQTEDANDSMANT